MEAAQVSARIALVGDSISAHWAAGVRWRVDMEMEALVIVGISGWAHVGRPVLYTPAYRKQNVA